MLAKVRRFGKISKINFFLLVCFFFFNFGRKKNFNIMTERQIQEKALLMLKGLPNNNIDFIEIKKPSSVASAVDFSKILSKLSPIVGNMLEFHIVDMLNSLDWHGEGVWKRQDPDFPDAVFVSDSLQCNVGLEVKAWFPLATEITGRFKVSTNLLQKNKYSVVLIAWLPEYVFWGRPHIIDVAIFDAMSVAEARNVHYHQPPRYVVREPEETDNRTKNLMQRNTSGFRFQESVSNNIDDASEYMKSIGMSHIYSPNAEYQNLVRQLLSTYNFREDTNFAKIDRIEHDGIEQFKQSISGLVYNGCPICEWADVANGKDNAALVSKLNDLFK